MANINRDYIVRVDVRTGKVTTPKIKFKNVDKSTSNIYVQLVIKETPYKLPVLVEEIENLAVLATIVKPNKAYKTVQAVLVDTIEGRLFELNLPDDCINLSGTYKVELTITGSVNGDIEQTTADVFTYIVEKSLQNELDPSIQDNEDLPVLKQLIEDIESTGGFKPKINVNGSIIDSVQGVVKIPDYDTKSVTQAAIKELEDARVDTDGTNHIKLGDRLNKVDSQIKDKASKQEVEIERRRIDSFITLPNGSTTGDAELIDGRIGADGVTYSNIGEAIRTQINNINENKNSWANVFFYEGKNPYWDTVNKTFTIYSGCPILVNGLSYVPSSDIVLPMTKINKTSYLGIYIDLSQSSKNNVVLDIISMQEMTIAHKLYSNYALIAVVNIDHNIYQANFVMNIDGVLQYSTTNEIKKYVDEKTKSDYIKILYGEEIDIFDNTFVDGEYFDYSTGQIIVNDTVSRTNYIRISGLNNIHTCVGANTTHQLAYFDKNKTFISGEKNNVKGDWKLSPPSNAYYVIIACLTVNKDSFYVRASMNSINSKYNTMKMNCLGDSITYGYIPDDGSQMAQPYPSILQNLLGLNTCRNYGISGSTLAVNSGNYDPMSVRYSDMDDEADIVSVFGGTNDYGRAIYSDLGTINDTDNSTIYGALDVLCNGLINKYPKAFIFFMTPLRRADKIGNNGGGYSLEDVSNAIKEVCYKYSIPVLDLYSKGGCHLENSTFRGHYGGNDKLHVNQSFMLEHLAPMIEKFIRSNI